VSMVDKCVECDAYEHKPHHPDCSFAPESDGERAHRIKEELWGEVHDLVDKKLAGESPAIEDAVREQMTEQFRFWKRTV